MVLEIDPQRPKPHVIKDVVNALRKGGVIIYPTDTVYAFGCDLHNPKAIERLCQIKGVKSSKSEFSFICSDLSQISHYSRQLDNAVFRVMKKALPGPYTFIVEANNKVPKLIQAKRKTVGIRIPGHAIPKMIVEELGNPIITTSLKSDDEVTQYLTDPEEIISRYENRVDFIIDAGYGLNEGSTVFKCSGNEIDVIREGVGSLDVL